MLEITDSKGLSHEVLKHVFLGDVVRRGNNIRVSGYHCNRKLNDELVYAVRKSKKLVTHPQGLFQAEVRDKTTHVKKSKDSTFYNECWNRQQVVDCIARAKSNPSNIVSTYGTGNVYKDPVTQVLVVPIGKTAFPLMRL